MIDNNKEASIRKQKRDIFMRRYGMGIIMVAFVIFLSVATDSFLTASNMISIIQQVTINGCVALGMAFVICCGGIDLSVGSYIGITTVILGEVIGNGGSFFMAAIAAALVCFLFGIFNGFVIAKFDIFPFVATLATQLIIRGIAYLLCGGYQKGVLDPALTTIATKRIFGVLPVSFLMMFVLIVVSYILMHQTKFGRYVYSVGGNINAAKASGVNIDKVRILTYGFCAICACMSGIIMTARTGTAMATAGTGYDADAIAACVIGGTSFAGGVATIPGVCIGIMMIGLIYNGMNMLGISSFWQTICKGLIILGAVMLDSLLNKKKA